MRRAFTMVELLVVIGIIAVLAALLFPVFARAKESAKGTACLSNLHQIGGALLLYMNDNDDFFPQAVDASDKAHPEQFAPFPDFQAKISGMPLIHEALQDYVKSKAVFHCPSDTGSEVLDDHFPLSFQARPSQFSTFGSSYLYRTEITIKGESQTALQNPSEVNVMFDGAGHWHGSAPAVSPSDSTNEFLDKLRNYRYETLYGDMHTKGLQYDQLSQLWAHPL